ncbi:MAG: RagB/SusD family nutrient uptake outer membrane protein [Prevotella sp.]|nr:RagB/SusD family nutrient uptake outer membrane protein [Prevotella sp.]
MKKILAYGLTALLALTSCEDFLDSANYTGKDSGNFPKTENDVNQMIASVYEASFYQPFANNDVGQYLTYSNLASDDMYGGGGSDDKATQALDHFMYNNNTQMESLWSAAYKAIARANSALAAIDNVEDEELRNQAKGELLFMRAFNYFDLVKCFGYIPMVEKSPENVQEAQTSPDQVEPDVIYKKIASDLKEAWENMPAYPYDGWSKLAYGKVSKWAAGALLARVYLFYTGFFNQSSLPTEDGEAITADYVKGVLDSIVANSGHGLLADYRSLWPYSNSATKADYDFVSDLGEGWSEGNKEVLFAINYLYLTDWSGTQLHQSNQYALFFGIRNGNWADSESYNKGAAGSTYPFGTGWGCGPVTPNFYDEWKTAEPSDKRREASVLEFPADYDWSNTSNWMEATGLHQKKFCAVRSGGGEYMSFCAQLFGSGEKGHFQASHAQSLPLIRYADVLLMRSELYQDAEKGMNEVRARAGLPAVGYSLTALQNERRWELAFEGYRWDDMRRWGIAEAALAKQVGGDIHNDGAATTMKDQGDGYVARYKATKGYYRIPQAQVDLSNGSIKQNAGWDGTTGYYSQWQ